MDLWRVHGVPRRSHSDEWTWPPDSDKERLQDGCVLVCVVGSMGTTEEVNVHEAGCELPSFPQLERISSFVSPSSYLMVQTETVHGGWDYLLKYTYEMTEYYYKSNNKMIRLSEW